MSRPEHRLFDPSSTRTPQWTDEAHDLKLASTRTEERQEAALDAAAQSWRRDAERTIEQLAASGREFVSDDLYKYVGPVMGPSPNVVGALFSAAARRGIIRRVGYRQSERESAAGRVVAVWRGTGGTA